MTPPISKPDIETRQALTNAVAAGFDEQTNFLADFVRIPSLRFEEGPAQDFMADAIISPMIAKLTWTTWSICPALAQ